MSTFLLKVITREGERLSRDVVSVDVPAARGRLTVLARHQRLVCRVLPGVVKVVDASGAREAWDVAGGALQVEPAETTLLVPRATRRD